MKQRKVKYDMDASGNVSSEVWWELSGRIFNKKAILRMNLHYSDPKAREVLTVFGEEPTTRCDNLAVNYLDRLQGWDYKLYENSRQIALRSGYDGRTVLFWEVLLNAYHDTDDVDMKCIKLGCNISNGYDYLIFYYTYTEKKVSQLYPNPYSDLTYC